MRLTSKDTKDAAIGCKDILANAQFHDIEIAFRESTYPSSVASRLLNHRKGRPTGVMR